MNSVSALKNTKNVVVGNFSIFTCLASIVANALILPPIANALILPPIYYFYKLIEARYMGYHSLYGGRYGNVEELVQAIPGIKYKGKWITDPRKEKGVVAGKVSIYRLTCVIGSIISLAFSILSLYSFISSWRFKNQMNAWGISFAILSPLVAAVTIFLQGQLVGGSLPELIKGIGIGRPSSTARDEEHYKHSETMMDIVTYITHIYLNLKMDTEQRFIQEPYYYSFVCALSLSFAAFAQSIAVYKLPNTMRISAFVVCANLCFALSKLILDAYYAYQCNIYDEKNRVVVMGEKIQESGVGAESPNERSLLQIRLSGTLSELRGALNTKLDEVMELLKQRVQDKSWRVTDRKRLVGNATLLKLALNSLNEPNTLEFLGLGDDIAGTADIAMNIMYKNVFQVGDRESAVYSTRFNGSDPAVLKADRADLTEPLKEGAYIHRFEGGKVKMEDQHLCYGMKEAKQPLMDDGDLDLGICRLHTNVGGISSTDTWRYDRATVTSLKLVTLVLAAKNSDIVVGDAISAIEQAIQEVAIQAEEKEGVCKNPAAAFNISPERLLQHIKGIESAFGFEVAKVATVQ